MHISTLKTERVAFSRLRTERLVVSKICVILSRIPRVRFAEIAFIASAARNVRCIEPPKIVSFSADAVMGFARLL